MSSAFDDWMTALWFGFFWISVSLLSRRGTMIDIIVFWCAVFPVLQSMVRDVLRAYFKRHPDDLWALELAAITAYVLAAAIVVSRVVRHRRRTRITQPAI